MLKFASTDGTQLAHLERNAGKHKHLHRSPQSFSLFDKHKKTQQHLCNPSVNTPFLNANTAITQHFQAFKLKVQRQHLVSRTRPAHANLTSMSCLRIQSCIRDFLTWTQFESRLKAYQAVKTPF